MYFRRIYDLREDRDIKQKAVAEYLGMDPTVYRRYEKGVRSVPVDVVIKLADYYNMYESQMKSEYDTLLEKAMEEQEAIEREERYLEEYEEELERDYRHNDYSR